MKGTATAAATTAAAAAAAIATAAATRGETNFQDKIKSLSNCKISFVRLYLLNRRILSDDLYVTFTRQ